MNGDDFYDWLEYGLYPTLRKLCENDDEYRKNRESVGKFLHSHRNAYSYSNCACILSAWVNEERPDILTFVKQLEDSGKNYWDGIKTDKYNVLPDWG